MATRGCPSPSGDGSYRACVGQALVGCRTGLFRDGRGYAHRGESRAEAAPSREGMLSG